MEPSRRTIWVQLMLYPTHTLPTAVAPVLVGVGLAVRDGVFSPWAALAAFVASWMVHVGGVFLDVHELLARHPGLGEHPELDAALASGGLQLTAIKTATAGWFVAAFLPGAMLVPAIGVPAAALLGVVGVGSAAWYAAGGRRSMASLGLADPVFFAMFAVVAPAATYWVQAATRGAEAALSPLALLAGLPVGALVTNVLVIDDLRDVAFDRRKGWRTTPVRFGTGGSRLEHLAFTCFAYLAPVAMARSMGPWLLLPLATLPAAVAAEVAVWAAPSREVLIPWTPRSAFLSMAFAALLAAGLALSR